MIPPAVHNSFTDSELLDEKTFIDVRDKIKGYIKKEVLLGEENKSKRAGIAEKLNELRRRSYISRVKELLDNPVRKVSQDSAKVTYEQLMDELEEIVDRRNEYIHQGKIEDYGLTITDFHLIRLLISIKILQILGCGDHLSDHDFDTFAVFKLKNSIKK